MKGVQRNRKRCREKHRDRDTGRETDTVIKMQKERFEPETERIRDAKTRKKISYPQLNIEEILVQSHMFLWRDLM